MNLSVIAFKVMYKFCCFVVFLVNRNRRKFLPPLGTFAEHALQTAIELSSSETVKKVHRRRHVYLSCVHTPVSLLPPPPPPFSSS